MLIKWRHKAQREGYKVENYKLYTLRSRDLPPHLTLFRSNEIAKYEYNVIAILAVLYILYTADLVYF